MNPTDALYFSVLKAGSASNQALLAPDPSMPASRSIAGVPVLTTPKCPVGTAYGLSARTGCLVLRSDTTVAVSRDSKFFADMVQIRAVIRCGFAWPLVKTTARIALAAS